MTKCLVVPVQHTQSPWGVASMEDNDPAPTKSFLLQVTASSSVFLSFPCPLFIKNSLTGWPQFTSALVDLPPLPLAGVHGNDSVPFQLSLTFSQPRQLLPVSGIFEVNNTLSVMSNYKQKKRPAIWEAFGLQWVLGIFGCLVYTDEEQ